MSEIKKEDKPSFQEENMMIEPVEERRVAISFQAKKYNGEVEEFFRRCLFENFAIEKSVGHMLNPQKLIFIIDFMKSAEM